MRKLLLFFVGLFGCISLYSQDLDVYYEPFTDSVIPFRWQMSSRWADDSLADWLFAGGVAFSYAGKEGLSETYLMSPGFSLSKENSDGEISFSAFSHVLDSTADSTTSWFGIGVCIDDDSTYRYGDIIYLRSSDSVQTYTFRLGDIINLTNTPHFYTFLIYHFGQHGDAGAFCIDHFVLRKRPDTYFMYFTPGAGEGLPFFNAAYANDTFVSPRNPFLPPEGKGFAYWYTWDADGVYGIFENADVWGVFQDMFWVAVWGDLFTVRFDANGGEGVMAASSGVQYRGFDVPACRFSRRGYRFVAWNTAADGSGESYDVGDILANMDTTIHPGDTVASFDLLSSEVTLYAQWQLVEEDGPEGPSGGSGDGPTNGVSSALLEQVVLYPNPADSYATLQGIPQASLRLTDLSGRTLRRVEQGSAISLEGLGKGVYMLHISTPEASTVRKIVKR